MDSFLGESESNIFTVIVLCYNNEQFLETCLDSVLMQNYAAIQIIVADDKSHNFNEKKYYNYISTHNSNKLADFCVYQNDKNLGTVANINTALKKARGKYIKIIAADDAFSDSNVLKNAVAALDASPDGIVTGDVMKCNANLEKPSRYPDRLQHSLNTLSAAETFKRLCVHNDIIAGGVFFDRRFFEKFGCFDESYKLLEDWPTWLKATKNGCRILYSSFNTIKYRSNGGVGTGTNPIYMKDKMRVLNEIIIPAKKSLGLIYYLKARLSFIIVNSTFVRKIYSILFRKGK